MADFIVDFSQAQPMNVKFKEESFVCDFGPGIPIGDYEGPYEISDTDAAASDVASPQPE